MALAERVRIPCMRRAAERRGLVVAWRRRRRFDWEVPLGPLHAIPPSAPAATLTLDGWCHVECIICFF